MPLPDLVTWCPDETPLKERSTCTTRGIMVKVTSTFSGRHEEYGNRWQYGIDIVNESNATVRLVSRHWFFYNADEQVCHWAHWGMLTMKTSTVWGQGGEWVRCNDGNGSSNDEETSHSH